MKFRFRLESILKHRESLKEVAQRDWMLAQNNVNDCLQKIQKMYEQIDQSRQLISQSEKSTASNQKAIFVSANEFLQGQAVRIERQRIQARELMSIAEKKREVLITATQNFEAMKKLKQKKYEEFKDKKKIKEARDLDDLVTMRFRRSGT